MRRGVAGLALALLVASCAHAPPPAGGGFRVECNVSDATVWIDDVLAGEASGWKGAGRQLRAGFHRIEIRHPGYYSVFQEIDLPAGGQAVVVARLRETLD